MTQLSTHVHKPAFIAADDLYAILEIAKDATEDEIEAAYKRLAKVFLHSVDSPTTITLRVIGLAPASTSQASIALVSGCLTMGRSRTRRSSGLEASLLTGQSPGLFSSKNRQKENV